jgi:hypothetical protein
MWAMELRPLSVNSHFPSEVCATSPFTPFIVLLRTALMLFVKFVAFVTTPAFFNVSAISAVAIGAAAVLSRSKIAHRTEMSAYFLALTAVAATEFVGLMIREMPAIRLSNSLSWRPSSLT